MTQDATSNSELQAKAQFSSIADLMAAYTFANDHSSCDFPADVEELSEEDREEYKRLVEDTDFEPEHLSDPDYIRERIEEDPLSIEVRGDWHTPGDDEGTKPSEYKILLCTGGPAVRIVGDLDEHCQPSSARLQHQDWFTPWVEVIDGIDRSVLLDYAQVFYYGE